jgi:hypothetical protein
MPEQPTTPPNGEPRDTGSTPIRVAWLGFTRSVRILLVPQLDDRPLDQYLAFREKVFKIVEGEAFLNDLEKTWGQFTDTPYTDIGAALLMELQAFPLAVEVAEATEKPKSNSAGWVKRLLRKASTISGSVKDIGENLPAYAKYGITLFKELLDVFKGRE